MSTGIKKIGIISALLFLLSVWFGYSWYEKTHSLAAQIAIEMLKQIDTEKAYEEYYIADFKNALCMGAWREDFDPPIKDNERAMRHFVGVDTSSNPPMIEQKGLNFAYYFYAWPWLQKTTVSYPQAGYYDNALNWALNGGRDGGGPENRYHLQGAMEAYDYTDSSKIEAYYRIGHVVHLLSDMSEPDHAENMSHALSGFTFPDDTEKIRDHQKRMAEQEKQNPTLYKRLKALIAAQMMILWRYSNRKMDPQIGFEGLIEDSVSSDLVKQYFVGFEEHLFDKKHLNVSFPVLNGSDIQGIINNIHTESSAHKQTGSEKINYVTYAFTDLASISVRKIKNGGLKTPLGLRRAGGYLSIPSINLKDNVDVARHFNLATSLLKSASEYNVGLLMHFFDIVNQPPFVKKIEITQAGAGQFTREWADKKNRMPNCPRKQGEDAGHYEIVTGRELTRPDEDSYEDIPFDPDKPVSLSIFFGPNSGTSKERIDSESIVIKIDGEILTGTYSFDSVEGSVWRGTYSPSITFGEDEFARELPIEISAKDIHSHSLRLRMAGTGDKLPEKGFELDSNPGSPAKAKYNESNYFWHDYEPAPDQNFKLVVKKKEEGQTTEESWHVLKHTLQVYRLTSQPEPGTQVVEYTWHVPKKTRGELTESDLLSAAREKIDQMVIQGKAEWASFMSSSTLQKRAETFVIPPKEFPIQGQVTITYRNRIPRDIPKGKTEKIVGKGPDILNE